MTILNEIQYPVCLMICIGSRHPLSRANGYMFKIHRMSPWLETLVTSPVSRQPNKVVTNCNFG